MMDKRFEIESNGIWEWRKKQLTWRELCDVLNELYEENKQLKEAIIGNIQYGEDLEEFAIEHNIIKKDWDRFDMYD